MNKRFKIVYYTLVALLSLVFSYQIYLLFSVLTEMPHYEILSLSKILN